MGRVITMVLLGIVWLLAAATPTAAQQQIDSRVDIHWNRYYDFEECEQIMRDLAEAYPELLTLTSIGQSEEGRELWMLILNNDKTGRHEEKPAMWIDGSIHANEIQATETTLYSIWYLVSAYDQVEPLTELVDRVAFYFVPVSNPDGRVAWFEEPSTPHMYRTGLRPTDTNFDGIPDSDGPEDLDGSGHIGMMWRRDPHGTHRRNPDDPRIFERVGPGESGEWSFAGWEGVDQSGDGQVNSDGPGGYDMNRNWPSDWQPNWIQRGAGDYPFSYPETRAIGEFLLAHPNVAAGQSYHNTGGMLLRGPGAANRGDHYPRADVRVYDRLGEIGEEMLPFYNYWVIHADLYTVHGGFVTWLHEGLGIVSFTNELWTDRRILQSGDRPTSEERMHWEDRLLFGQTFTEYTEYDHPQLGEVLIGGGTEYSRRIPPPWMLEEECHRNFAFSVFHARNMPELDFHWISVENLGESLWEITLEVRNTRIIPTRTAVAARKGIGTPDRMIVHTPDGTDVVASGTMDHRHDDAMQSTDHRRSRILSDAGVPGEGVSTYRFLIRGEAGESVDLEYQAEKAMDIRRSVELREGVVESDADDS